jgi:hypothetical protein
VVIETNFVGNETNETSIGIMVGRGHELNTCHGNKNTNKEGMKPHKARGPMK